MTTNQRLTWLISQFTLFFFLFIGGLAASRILYEALFPRWLWLGRPLPAFGLAAMVAFAGWSLYGRARAAFPALLLSPLLLNLIYLADPRVNLVQSRFIFAAALWLCGVLLVVWRWPAPGWRGYALLLLALLPVYLLTVAHTVGRDDTFEFQVVTPQLGIVHPTGYPLYLLLGRLFTLLPLDSVAWRLNVASIVYATLAACLMYTLLLRWWQRPLPAILGAVVTGLTPTLWGQAIVAEVYALHALIVTAVLLLLQAISQWHKAEGGGNGRYLLPLAALLGLGLTNHLTTVFLLPAAALTLILVITNEQTTRNNEQAITNYQLPISSLQSLIPKLTLALFAPLALYAYLPLRWRAVNGQPMGMSRFVDWVVGGRFQGALVWRGWLDDPTRYEIVGRLFLQNWGWVNLVLMAIGLVYVLLRWRRAALLLGVTWLGYTFYCLNYYVPDLAVFLIPAQLIMGIFWTAGLTAVLTWRRWHLDMGAGLTLTPLLLSLLLIPTLQQAVANWSQIDQSADDGRTRWGTAVLDLPLAENAAILADSDKFPPLYYLQQSEGLRPDLDISVWPDEAAYRQQLDGRLANGQTVYLARFLPGLAGVYHLNSVGPLIEVRQMPRTALPASATPSDLTLNGLRLLGYDLETPAAVSDEDTAVTFYWQSAEPLSATWYIYVRWAGQAATNGQHPANNSYPTVAWRPNEVVADYHQWPYPIVPEASQQTLQVALAPPFTPPDALDWHTVTTTTLETQPQRPLAHPYRASIGDFGLTGATFAERVRPLQPYEIVAAGSGDSSQLFFDLQPAPISTEPIPPISLPTPDDARPALRRFEGIAPEHNGRYQLSVTHPQGTTCGWLRPSSLSCPLGIVTVDGAPLPPGATNFEDKIALLDIAIPDVTLQPGGQLNVTLTWQSLATLDKNYTAFVQVLDAQDKIVGQVDSWPVQGTFPTSQWPPGETVTDPYVVQLAPDLPSGTYRLQVGWYLLETLRRLPVVDDGGTAVDDKVTVPGLIVP